MQLWLEVDGQRVGEVHDFKLDEPPKLNVWGPVFVHQRVAPPDTCTFVMKGAPPQQGLWITVVDNDGVPVHELQLLHIDTRMALGGANSTIKARIL